MEQIIIYVAGDPDAFPLEYYDDVTQSYQGVIPELLRRFSEQSQYDVRYYAPGEKDQRQALAANQQVDIVSCYENVGDLRHRSGEDILLLEDVGDGQAAALCLLDVAPEGLADDLRSFLSGVSQREMTGMVLQAAQDAPLQSRWQTRALLISAALAAALLAALVGVIVSSRRRLKKTRQKQYVDPVTGIGNRAYLEKRCQTYLNGRNRVLYTLFCFCFDPSAAYAAENETAFPRHMASVLQDFAGDADLLARVSDNGFALLRLSPGKQDSEDWLSTVLCRLRETWQDGCGQMPKISVGVCPLKADDLDWNEFIFRGLQTAQAARQKGLDYQIFSDEIQRGRRREQRLRADIRPALQNQEFQIYLQFCTDARTGRTAGAEVVLMWGHPEMGLLPASHWLPLLEQEELLDQLNDYVLDRICALLDHLQQNGREDFFLLYHLSGEALSSEHLEDGWKNILSNYHFDCGRLLLGIPQDAAQRDGAAGGKGVDTLRAMGMGLVLDGFDGEMIDLARAGDARFCGLTLDQKLTNQAETASGRAALESVFQLGHKLALRFLAEDIASEDQAVQLRQLGCDLLCGELYAHPLPAWEALKKLMGQDRTEVML